VAYCSALKVQRWFPATVRSIEELSVHANLVALG
jgi:hypothetical protein